MASSVIGSRDFFLGRQWRQRPYLISPFFDFMLAGGLPLFLFVAFLLFVPATASEVTPLMIAIALLAAYGASFFNGSHFIASYHMLYEDYPGKLRRFRNVPSLLLRYIVAGIVVPAFFLVFFGYVLVTKDAGLFATSINLLLMLVGWHYAKQCYGICIVLSAMKKIYYTPAERRILLGNTYIVTVTYAFMIATTDAVGTAAALVSLNLPYEKLHFTDVPPAVTWAVIGSCALSSLLALITLWRKNKPALSAYVGYLTMYTFLIGILVFPPWTVLIGPLHGLQYWMFVYAYRRGEAHHTPVPPFYRDVTLGARAPVYFLLSVMAGVLLLEFLPHYAESWLKGGAEMFLPFAYAVFIATNVQHYFIDNVVWRRENAEISTYMFHP